MFNNLWTEKYRPNIISEYICNNSLKEDLLQFVQNGNIPNILLASEAGFGKTSLAKLIVKELKAESLYLNSSLNRSIDDVRESIITFASTYSLSNLKIVILDEADGMTIQALESLKGVMEQYCEHTRFIFTTNQLNKIPPPIRSRCLIYELENAPKKEIGKRCIQILKNEKVEYDNQTLVNVINYYYPDIRKIVSSLQMCSINGTLVFDETHISKGWFWDVLEIINSEESVDDKFYKVRQILLDNSPKNLDEVYSMFFQNLKNFPKKAHCEITISLAEALHRSVTIPDKELNLMACISQILTILK